MNDDIVGRLRAELERLRAPVGDSSRIMLEDAAYEIERLRRDCREAEELIEVLPSINLRDALIECYIVCRKVANGTRFSTSHAHFVSVTRLVHKLLPDQPQIARDWEPLLDGAENHDRGKL